MKFKYKTTISIEKSLKVFKDNLIGWNSKIRQPYQLKNLLKFSKITWLVKTTISIEKSFKVFKSNLIEIHMQDNHINYGWKIFFLKKTTWLKFKCKTTISIMVEKKKRFQRKQLDWNSNARQPYQLWLKKKRFQRKQLDWNSNARQPYQLRLKKKSFQRKQLDWLKIKKNARQHDKGKKTIMAINTIPSSFLKT